MSPKIVSRTIEFSCPWLAVEAKDVQLDRPRRRETFYSIRTASYVAVVAVTEEDRVPLVRQFRPAVEERVLELPSGLIEAGEDPESAIRRELREETGCEARRLVDLGSFHVDSGRMQTRQQAFFAPGVLCVGPVDPTGDDDLEAVFVERPRLRELIARGEFNFAGHLGVLCAAMARGCLEL